MSKQGNRRSTGPANRFSSAINAEIRAARGRRGLNNAELSRLTGISQARLSKTIAHDSAPLNTNELDYICTALQVDPTSILRAAEAQVGRSHNQAFDQPLRMGTPDDALSPGEPGYVAPPHDLYRLAANDEPSEGRERRRRLDESEGA